MDRRKL
jgi:hypothetical protein